MRSGPDPLAAASAAQLRLAEALLAQSRADEAEQVLARLAVGASRDAGTIATLAALRAAQGRFDEATRHAEDALRLAPLPTRLVVSLAETLARAHRHEAADAALAAAIERGGAELDLRASRARLAERRGRTDLALRHWQRALAVAPEDMETRLGIVRALRGEGRFTAAETKCRQLLAAAPTDHRPHAEHARIAQDAGDAVEAESRWHAALLAHPGNVAALLGLAQSLAAQHRFDDARSLLDGLAREGRARAETLAAIVRASLVEGDLDRAEAHARQLGVLEPARLGYRMPLGRVLEARAEHAEAEELYVALAAEHPQAPEPRLAAAELAAKQGDLARARDGFAAILADDGSHLEALLGLAGVLAELGLRDEAGEAVDRALVLAPNQPKTHLRKAAVAELQGRLEAARLALLEARSALPWREEPLLQLVQLALRHGQLEAAAEHAAALVALHPRSLGARLAAFDAAIAGRAADAAREILAGLAGELPEHREVQRRLARLDWLDGSVERARARWARMSRRDSRLHGGPDAVARLDRHPLPAPRGEEVRAFLLVRNEAVRLPWLLAYYRELGIDRFLVLDNDSDDGTREWLLAQGPGVHVFHTADSFAASGAGMRWTNRLLDEHGTGAWCLTIDADEVLVYPGAETLPIKGLVAYLEAVGAEALVAPMIDLYAAAPLDAVAYAPGQSLIEAFPWFDGSGYVRRDSNDFPFFRLLGGCRARVFYETLDAGPILQKVPLIRWAPGIKYTSSKHTAFPCRLPDISGALLHFKYLPDFAEQVRAEVARGQHYLGAKEYRAYQRRLERGEALSLADPASCRYRDSRQLVELGLVQTSARFEEHVRQRCQG